jgi:hypothetical protein
MNPIGDSAALRAHIVDEKMKAERPHWHHAVQQGGLVPVRSEFIAFNGLKIIAALNHISTSA